MLPFKKRQTSSERQCVRSSTTFKGAVLSQYVVGETKLCGWPARGIAQSIVPLSTSKSHDEKVALLTRLDLQQWDCFDGSTASHGCILQNSNADDKRSIGSLTIENAMVQDGSAWWCACGHPNILSMLVPPDFGT